MSRTIEGHMWTPIGSIEGLETKSAIITIQPTKDSYDVIVVGSGFASLVAARDISQHSKASILLLEARDRMGGRTWTARVDNEDIEMGGTWVHWTTGVWSCWGPKPMSKYLAELQKSEGRVVFASADWADGWRGFVDGALERGKVAARDAVEIARQESRAES